MIRLILFLSIGITLEFGQISCQSSEELAFQLCPNGQYSMSTGVNLLAVCVPCPCPNNSNCLQLPDETITCLNCPKGYAGQLCDKCDSGYFDNSAQELSEFSVNCVPCNCNGNADISDAGSCDRQTGVCHKCLNNTTGDHCESCAPGFYGNALQRDCKPCSCNLWGSLKPPKLTSPIQCDRVTGDCLCVPHAKGKLCDECEDGYYFQGDNGCKKCDCDPIGSIGENCSAETGQCKCRPGVSGQKCDVCAPLHYGFSSTGCTECNCHKYGSKSTQCDEYGRCPCHDQVEGKTCDKCIGKKLGIRKGCFDCPRCYDFVEAEFTDYKQLIDQKEQDLIDISADNSTDTDFDIEFEDLKQTVDDLKQDTFSSISDINNKNTNLTELAASIQAEFLDSLPKYIDDLNDIARDSQDLINMLENELLRAKDSISQAEPEVEAALTYIKTEGKKALEDAEKFSETVNSSKDLENIAKEAKDLATELENNVNTITDLATQVKNISDQLLSKEPELNELFPNETDSWLEYLQNRTESSKNNMQELLELVDDTKQLLLDTKNDYIEIIQDINNATVPEINIPELGNRIEAMNGVSNRIIREADDFLNGPHLYQKIKKELETNSNVMESWSELVKEWNAMLESVNNYNNMAKEAIKMANDVLENAKKTLEEVSENNNLKKVKEAAKDALNERQQIKNDMNEISIEINNFGGRVSEIKNNIEYLNISVINGEIQDSKQQVKSTQDDVENIQENLNSTEDTLQNLDDYLKLTEDRFVKENDVYKKDEALLKESSKNQNKLHSDMESFAETLNKRLLELEDIRTNLNNPIEIDEQTLNKLERRIKLLEKQLNDDDISGQISKLQNIQVKQTYLISMKEDELKFLENEVENVKYIAAALPEACYKPTDLQR